MQSFDECHNNMNAQDVFKKIPRKMRIKVSAKRKTMEGNILNGYKLYKWIDDENAFFFIWYEHE